MSYYYWDFDTDNVFLEEDEHGDTIAEYTHEPRLYGELIAQQRDGEVRYYNFDGQGSTRELTDENGDVTDTYTYTAYGEEIANTGTTENPFRNKGAWGYYTNSDTNDIYVRSRPYQPATGRWLSPDGTGFVDGANRYLYVLNSPLNFIDPSGNNTIDIEHVIKDQGCKDCGTFHWDVTFKVTVGGFRDENNRDRQFALVQRLCIKWEQEFCEGDGQCCTMTRNKAEGFCCFNEFLGFIYVVNDTARMDALAKTPDQWMRDGVDRQCYNNGKIAFVSDLYVVPGSDEYDKIEAQMKQNRFVKVPCGVGNSVNANPGPETIGTHVAHTVGIVEGSWECCPKKEPKPCKTDTILPF